MDQHQKSDSRSPIPGRRMASFLGTLTLVGLAAACTEVDGGGLQFALNGGTITGGTVLVALSGAQSEGGEQGELTLGDGPFADDPDFELTLAPSSSAVTNGGTAVVGLSAPSDFDEIIVMVAELDHHFLIQLPAPTSAADVLLTVEQTYSDPFVTFQLAVGDGTDYGPLAEVTYGVVQVGSGDVQVSLTFDRPQDLDLWVMDPNGDLLNWDSDPGEPDDVPSGGTLDLDANAACSVLDERAENITWPSGSGIPGTYTVYLDLWSTCDDDQDVNWVITVSVKGREPQIFQGTYLREDVVAPVLEVTTFEGPVVP